MYLSAGSGRLLNTIQLCSSLEGGLFTLSAKIMLATAIENFTRALGVWGKPISLKSWATNCSCLGITISPK